MRDVTVNQLKEDKTKLTCDNEGNLLTDSDKLRRRMEGIYLYDKKNKSKALHKQ